MFAITTLNCLRSDKPNLKWPHFGKELLTRFTICSFCILTIYKLSYFPFLVQVRDLGSDMFLISMF